jgi:hypothetical protein
MSNLSLKEGVLNQVGTYSSIAANNGNSKKTSSLSSLNNSKDPIPFLMDIIVLLGGAAAINKLIDKLFPQVISQVEIQLKQILLTQVDNLPNSNAPISSISILSNGMDVPLKHLDVYDKYKIGANDPSYGSIMYPPNSFDNKIKTQVMTSSTAVNVNGFNTTYNQNTESFNFQLPQQSNIGVFLTGYINSIQLINKTEFILTLLDMVFGTFSFLRKKSVQRLIEEEKLNKIIEGITTEQTNEDVYTLTKEQLEEIDGIAKMKSNGIMSVDVGCGYADIILNEGDFNNTLSTLNTTMSPSNVLLDSFDTATSHNTGNKSSMKDGFIKYLIKCMTTLIVRSLLLTPQMIIFRILIQTITHKTSQPTQSTADELKKIKQYVDTIAHGSKGTIVKTIFDFTVKMVTQLVKTSSQKILQEKTKMYFKILTSLRP